VLGEMRPEAWLNGIQADKAKFVEVFHELGYIALLRARHQEKLP